MLSKVVNFEGNMLSDRSVIKRADGLKLVRRAGKVLVIEPSQGGSWLVHEAEQALFAQLNRPGEVKEILAAVPDQANAEALLVKLFNVGIVQVLGKSGTRRVADSHPALIVHYHNERVQQADCPSCVKHCWLESYRKSTGSDICSQDWAAFCASIPEGELTLETIVIDSDDVRALGEVVEAIRATRTIDRLIIKMYPQERTVTALIDMLTEGDGKHIKAEVLCYCPAADLDSHKALIGNMLKHQIACLPVGCLESAAQLVPWIDMVLAWRYRSLAVCQSALTSGDVLAKQAELQALLESWQEVVAKIARYGEESQVRLRVHPLEKWLVTLGRSYAMESCHYVVRRDSAGILQWGIESELATGCQRCFAYRYCNDLARCEAGGGECWLRKKLFLELLWRLHTSNDIVNYCFVRRNAL